MWDFVFLEILTSPAARKGLNDILQLLILTILLAEQAFGQIAIFSAPERETHAAAAVLAEIVHPRRTPA